MDGTGFLQFIHEVKDPWTIAAFAIAAILAAYNVAFRKPDARKGLWIVIAAICVLAIVPMALSLFTNPVLAIYRVRVTVLDDAGIPAEGAVVKTTALNATATGSDGSCELTIPKGSLQQGGKITIFADQSVPGKPRLHGTADVTLASDANPSVTIRMQKLPGAPVSGIVEDKNGVAVSGARVVIPGVEATTTDWDGNFKLQSNASPGEEVELHAEGAGCAVTQRHPVDAGSATLTLPCALKSRRRK
jgi:hypothetical protein